MTSEFRTHVQRAGLVAFLMLLGACAPVPPLEPLPEPVVEVEPVPEKPEVVSVDRRPPPTPAVVEPPRDPDILLRVERPGRNLYPPGGRNLGMSLASGAYLVTLDDDAVWHTPGAVARMCQLLEENPTCGVVAVRSLDAANQPIVSEQPHPNKPSMEDQG